MRLFNCLWLALLPSLGLAASGSDGLASRLARLAPDADPQVLREAVVARRCAIDRGLADAGDRLAVIDYSKPSSERRLWVFDLAAGRLLYDEWVAHGQGSGENRARAFSNQPDSHRSSLGLFRTADTYIGGNGYSLRLDGLEPGFNDRARERAIVVHGAWYVDPGLVPKQGRIGRSHGCPALRPAVARPLIDTLKGGQMLFAWYPDPDWQRQSRLLNCAGGGSSGLAAP